MPAPIDFETLVAADGTQSDLDRFERRKVSRFPVRFMVEVGIPLAVNGLVTALWLSGNHVSEWARGLLPQVTISDRKIIKIVAPTVKELGFTAEWTCLRDIHTRGIELGYELVPSDLVLSLRLQYVNQPVNDEILMAMKALKLPGGSLSLFRVRRGIDGRFVCCRIGNPEAQYLRPRPVRVRRPASLALWARSPCP